MKLVRKVKVTEEKTPNKAGKVKDGFFRNRSQLFTEKEKLFENIEMKRGILQNFSIGLTVRSGLIREREISSKVSVSRCLQCKLFKKK